jgi:hypothetical protein
MGKLTPTFADQVATGGVAGAPMRVLAPHEPLGTGEKPPLAPLAGMPPNIAGLSPFAGACQIGQSVEPAPLKIALVGTAPSSRMLAPFNDPTWKIWGCSPGNMNVLPRYDAWFEIHSNLLWPSNVSYGAPYIEWLKQQKVPVYMQNQAHVPNATVFPWQEMTEEFGNDFFTSSFAWMMAFAMKQGAKEIGLFGIDMASRDEYILQRPGFYFFRWEAQRRGVKITAPNESDIMQSPPLYAYSDSTPLGRKILSREEEIKGRVAGMINERDKLNQNITYLQGALEDLDYFKAIWTGAQKPA